MTFKGGRKNADSESSAPANVLSTVEVDGSKIQVIGNSFAGRGGTMHTIRLAGLGKNTEFGPQKFLAVLGACAKSAKYFQENDLLELTAEQMALLEQVEQIVNS